MTERRRRFGSWILLLGVLIACVGLSGLALAAGKLIPSQGWASVLENIRASVGLVSPYRAFEPDEMVFDNSLGAEVPRLYYLSIPKLDLYAPVVGVTTEVVSLDGIEVERLHVPNAFAAGWSTQSAPIGSAGNSVLVGHNNIYGEVFKGLWLLQTGDEILVLTAGGERRFVVESVNIFSERDQPLQKRIANAKWIAPARHEQLTLVTCYPYHTNTHRLVVVANPSSS